MGEGATTRGVIIFPLLSLGGVLGLGLEGLAAAGFWGCLVGTE